MFKRLFQGKGDNNKDKKQDAEKALLKPLILKGHTDKILCVALNQDLNLAVTGSEDKTLRVWNIKTGECIRELKGHTNFIVCVAITPDGNYVLSGGHCCPLRMWNLRTGSCVRVDRYSGYISSIAISQDGNLALLGGSLGGTIQVRNLKTGNSIRELQKGYGNIRSVALSRDGNLAISGSDDKEFTLRVWDLKTGECVRELKGHTNSISSIVISKDGNLALSGSWDSTLRVWNLKSGECIRELKGHTYIVNSVVLSQDGNLALSGGRDNTLRVWNLKTGECERILNYQTSDSSSHVSTSLYKNQFYAFTNLKDSSLSFQQAYSLPEIKPVPLKLLSSQNNSQTNSQVSIVLENKDKKEMAELSNSQVSVALENKDKKEMAELLESFVFNSHDGNVTSVAMDLDLNLALSGGDDTILRVWNLKTRKCIRELKGHEWFIWSVVLSQDGNLALSGAEDKTLRLWDLKTGECVRVFKGHKNSVYSVALSKDSTVVLSGSYDKTLRVWDIKTGECVRELKGHIEPVRCVDLSQDGNLAVSGSYDKSIRVWNLKTGECMCELKGHTNVVNSVVLSQDGNLAISGSDDNTLRVWNLKTGECVRELKGHSSSVAKVTLSQDGNFAVSGSWDKTLRVWDLKTGACVRLLTYEREIWSISTALHQNQLYALAGLKEGNISFQHAYNLLEMKPHSLEPPYSQNIAQTNSQASVVLEKKDKKETAEFLKSLKFKGHNWVTSVVLSQNGNLALSGGWDDTVRVWNLKTGECLREFKGHKSRVNSVALSGDGNLALSGSSDDTLRVWSLTTGECMRIFNQKGSVLSVALSQDGNLALSGSYENVLLWNLKHEKCVLELKGHTDAVNSVALSEDGNFALSGSYDKTLRLWNLKTGECVRKFIGHTDQVSSVALNMDKNLGLSGSYDNTLRVWNLKTGECVGKWEAHRSSVYSVALNSDGNLALTGGDDPRLRLWNLKTGECERALKCESNIMSISTITHQNQLYALTGDVGGNISFLPVYIPGMKPVPLELPNFPNNSQIDSQTSVVLEKKVKNEMAEILAPLQLKGHTNVVTSVVISQNGKIALSGSGDETLRVWNLNTGECLRKLKGHIAYVICVALSEDRNLALSGCADSTLRVWNLKTGECVKELKGHTNSVMSVALSKTGNLALSGSLDGTLRLWNLVNGDCVQEFRVRELRDNTDAVSCVVLSKDSSLVLSGSDDTILRMWDIKTGECVREFKGHTDRITSVALSEDGNLTVSGSEDKTLRMWDMRTGECVRELKGHTDRVTSVALSEDGSLAFSGSDDKTTRVWNLKTGECLSGLNYQECVFSISILTRNNQIYALAALEDGTISFQPLYTLPEAKPADKQIQNQKSDANVFAERKGNQERKEIKEERELEDSKEEFEKRLNISFKIDYNMLKFGQRLGEGGFGIVYQGMKGHEEVAIKQLKIDHISDDARDEFEAEVQTMAKLRSKYIVQFYGYCLSPKYTIVMEFMPKGALNRLLLNKGDLSWELRARIMTDMAHGLNVLHTANILHRDIKSLNVLLDDQFHAKFSDFGLSKVKSETRTSTKSVGGTLQWMAPELFSLRPKHTKASDVYSLGVTFWEIAARNLPYLGAAEAIIKDAIKNGEREQIPDDCPKRFATLIQACWDGKIDNRPDSDSIVAYLKSGQEDFKTFLTSFMASRNVSSAQSFVGNLNSVSDAGNSGADTGIGVANNSSLVNSSFNQSLVSNLASGKP